MPPNKSLQLTAQGASVAGESVFQDSYGNGLEYCGRGISGHG